jgi:hypothetical protein
MHTITRQCLYRMRLTGTNRARIEQSTQLDVSHVLWIRGQDQVDFLMYRLVVRLLIQSRRDGTFLVTSLNKLIGMR